MRAIQEFPEQYPAAAIAAAKPTDRAKLRRAIAASVTAVFDESIIPFSRRVEVFDGSKVIHEQVAVGTAQVEFDESDPLILRGKLTYRHNNPTAREESDAILDALCSTVTIRRMGPVAAYIDAHDSHSDRAAGTPYFQCGFRINCHA